MSGILKIVLLVALAMAFFTQPGEGADDLKCYECDGNSEEDDCTKGGYNSVNCAKKSDSIKYDVCYKLTLKKDDTVVAVGRHCGLSTAGDLKGIKKNECGPELTAEGKKYITCICDTELCNSAQSLNGWPFIQILVFSFGVIILIGFNQ